MRINFEGFSFDSPAGFEDSSNYTFKDSSRRELLTVSFGARPAEATDLPALLALRRDNLDIVVPGKVTLEAEAGARVDGMAARTLSFTFEADGVLYRERWAVALPTPEIYLQISYVARAADSNAQQRFEHILRSVVPARRTPTIATPSAYVRRWAKRMTLDVPKTLSPPRTIQFASLTGHAVLGFQYFDAADAIARQRFLESEGRENANGKDRKAESVDTKLGPVEIVSYMLTVPGNEDPPSAVRKAAFTIGAIQIEAFTRGPAAEASQMDGLFRQWIGTFETVH